MGLRQLCSLYQWVGCPRPQRYLTQPRLTFTTTSYIIFSGDQNQRMDICQQKKRWAVVNSIRSLHRAVLLPPPHLFLPHFLTTFCCLRLYSCPPYFVAHTCILAHLILLPGSDRKLPLPSSTIHLCQSSGPDSQSLTIEILSKQWSSNPSLLTMIWSFLIYWSYPPHGQAQQSPWAGYPKSWNCPTDSLSADTRTIGVADT